MEGLNLNLNFAGSGKFRNDPSIDICTATFDKFCFRFLLVFALVLNLIFVRVSFKFATRHSQDTKNYLSYIRVHVAREKGTFKGKLLLRPVETSP
jgi:hypothetical protein